MHHLNALILVVVTCVSCDVFEDAFERAFYKAIIGAEQKLTDKGSFENCAPTETSFNITWDPDPLQKNKFVTIEGYYKFPEDFEAGVIDVTASIYTDKYPVKCKDFWPKHKLNPSCKNGTIAHKKQSMPVPSIAPAGFSFTLTAKLTNNKTEHEIMCAKANVRVAGDY